MPVDSKRKADVEPTDSGSDQDSDGSEVPDFINVDFDFRAPQEIDFLALKRLLQQLFYTHSVKLDLSALADHVVKMSTGEGVGTAIKVEGDEDQDPYAFVSAIDLDGSTAAQNLTKYLLEVLNKPASKSFHDLIKSAASTTSTAAPVTVVLHERMVNMPPQVAPPLYKLLNEELQASRSARVPSPVAPSHYLFYSRVFSADAFSDDEAMDEDDDDEPSGIAGARRRRAKLARREAKKAGANKHAPKTTSRTVSDGMGIHSGTSTDEELGLFHPEDIAISHFASHTATFRFPPPPDAADSFEAPLFGRIAAVPASQLDALLSKIETDLSAPLPQ